MQMVIDIPDIIYKQILKKHVSKETIARIFSNGTPIDLDGLKSDMKALNCGYPYGLDYLLECLNKRLGITIIEADKETEV